MMYMLHAFDHPRYRDYDGSLTVTEFPLRPPERGKAPIEARGVSSAEEKSAPEAEA